MKRALITSLFAATCAFAQTSERITVEVVNVPVYVTRDSKPVRGLTRDDFELFVNGKPQRFDYFDVIDFTPAGTAAAPRTNADVLRDRRLFLLAFDLAFTSPAMTQRAVRAAESFVDRADASDLFSVAVLSPRSGTQFVIPFTSDRPLVRRALHALRPQVHHDPLGIVMPELERREWLRAGDENVPANPREKRSALGGEAEPAPEIPKDLQEAPLRNMIDFDLRELAEIADRLSGLEGYRHVIVFSEGVNGTLLHGVMRRGATSPDPRLLEDMQRVHHHYQAAGVFLDSVDVAGLRHTFEPFENDSLLMMSLATGGQFVHNRNDLAGALSDLTESQQLVYLIGFKHSATKKTMNDIEVRVKHAPRGTAVSYRRGFATSMPETPVDALQLADIIMNDTPQSGLAATLTPIANGVHVDLPQSDATLMLYVFDDKGGIVDYRERKNGVTFDESFTLPPGSYVAKALLRIGNSVGFSRIAFAIQ